METMTWQQVCENSDLHNLPYKIELGEKGQIIMSPARLAHGYYQFEIGRILSEGMQQQGKIITECAIRTSKGTKVADVAWFQRIAGCRSGMSMTARLRLKSASKLSRFGI